MHTIYWNNSDEELLALMDRDRLPTLELWAEIVQRFERQADQQEEAQKEIEQLETAADVAEDRADDLNAQLAEAEEALDRMTDERDSLAEQLEAVRG